MKLFIFIVFGLLLIEMAISTSKVLYFNNQMDKNLKKFENISIQYRQADREIANNKRLRQSQREKKTASVSVIHWENDSVHGTPEQAETKRKIIDDLIKKMN